MMSKLTVLDGHNLIDPAYCDNPTGRWLCDGLTAHQWASEGIRLSHPQPQPGETADVFTIRRQLQGHPPTPMTGDAIEAFAISGALQALDTNEETLDFYRA